MKRKKFHETIIIPVTRRVKGGDSVVIIPVTRRVKGFIIPVTRRVKGPCYTRYS